MTHDDSRSRYIWASTIFLLFAVINAISRNNTYPFDSVIFAAFAENPVSQLRADLLFEWNHFLWYPTGRVFYLALQWLHISLRGYQALQLLNALTGAAGAALVFLILCRLVSRSWALRWALAAGFCAVYWARSAGAENYLAGTFWIIAFCYFLLSYWQEPSDTNLAAMMVCSVLSAYYHLGNLAIVGCIFVVVIMRLWRRSVSQMAKAILLLTVLWLPYAKIHQWFEPGGFAKWWLWSKGLAEGFSPLETTTGGFQLTVITNLPVAIATFMRSILWFDSWNAVVAALFATTAILVAVLVFSRERGQSAKPGYVFLIPLASLTVLYAVWQPSIGAYWSVHTAVLCLFAGAVTSPKLDSRVSQVPAICMTLIVGILAAHNFRSMIWPHKVNPQQFLVDASLEVSRITPVRSPIVISGRGKWMLMKPYLEYFARRHRLAIDLFAANGVLQNRDPVAWLKESIDATATNGIPVYIMDDVLTSKSQFSDFGLSSEQVESIWNRYTLLPVKDFAGNPPNRLYLLWSNDLPDRAQDSICAELRLNGLADQLLAVFKERRRVDKSNELEALIRYLEHAQQKP